MRTPRQGALVGFGFVLLILLAHGWLMPDNVRHWPSYSIAIAFIAALLGVVYQQPEYLGRSFKEDRN